MTARPTEAALAALAAPARRGALAGAALAAVGGVTSVFAIAAWALRLDVAGGPAWVLASWAAAAGAMAAAGCSVPFILGRTTAGRLAQRLESAGEWRRGALTALLGPPARGVSASLLGTADRATARELLARGRPVVGRLTAGIRRLRMGALAAALLGTALLLAARPLDGAAAALWRPRHALRAALAPVRIRASAATVDRGDSVAIDIEADDRRQATLWLRSPGEAWRGTPVALDAGGRGRVISSALTADLYARAVSGGRSSDTLEVRVRIPAFLGTVSVTAEYPAYLRRDPEPLPLNGDTVALPAGTRLVTLGQATAPLGAGSWSGPGEFHVAIEPRGDRFGARFTPTQSGRYALSLTTAAGAPLSGAAISLPIEIIQDVAPTIDIPVPGADTAVGTDLQVPLVLEGRDDHGIARLEVEARRQGAAQAWTDTVALPAGDPDHVALPWMLDLRGHGLLPGDTVVVAAWATDNAPGPHRVRSREYRFRLSTLAEVRAETRAATASVQSGFDSLAAAGRSVSRQTEDLAIERARAGADDRRGEAAALSFEAAERASAVARAQAALEKQVEGLRDAVAHLERQASAAGVADPAWQAELDQIRQELDRALTPELKQRLADLESAIHDLDADRTRSALQDLGAQQKALREALDRSRELFRRAAIEGDLANLGAQADQLAARQEAWDRAVASTPSTSAAAQERALAAEADTLAGALDTLAPRLAPDGRDSATARAAAEARQAASEMRDAAALAGKSEPGPAQEKGTSAERRLTPLANGLSQQRQQLQKQWRADVTSELDRALAETARLSTSELALSGEFAQGEPVATLRGRQAAIVEGAQRVIAELRDASGRNAIVSPQLAIAMTQALLDMQRVLGALSSAVPDLAEGGGRAGDAVDGLNAAAYLLLRNRDDVAGSGSGSGLAEAMARMRELAGQQGSLGDAAAGLLPSFATGKDGVQVQALGGRERAIADQLERLRAGGQLPGAGALADEAKDLARRLESGQLDRTSVERQQRLFRRMLDAGRTLQGNEDDPDRPRVSRTAVGDSVHVPPPLLRLPGADAPRMPSWSDLERYSPAERRLVADYFQRLLAGGR